VDFDEETGEGRRNRTIAFSVFGLVTLGVVLGLLIGGLGLAAMRSTNLDVGGADPTEATSDASAAEQTTEPSATEPTTEETTDPTADAEGPTLTASPTAVGVSEEIYLEGSFPDVGAGVTVQVQRRQDGTWLDFPDSTSPVTATTQDDGSFSTYVLTGQTGVNVWRVVALDTGAATNSARVTVG